MAIASAVIIRDIIIYCTDYDYYKSFYQKVIEGKCDYIDKQGNCLSKEELQTYEERNRLIVPYELLQNQENNDDHNLNDSRENSIWYLVFSI